MATMGSQVRMFAASYNLGYSSSDKSTIVKWVTHLLTCEDHSGTHHFAVIDEGHTVVLSETAALCLRKAGLI